MNWSGARGEGRGGSLALSAALVAAALIPLRAQGRPADAIEARHQVAAFESALENAVQYGAQTLIQHVQSSTMPEEVLLTGQARARGFRLDGYGVVFDVVFPSIRRSVAWTMRTLERPDPELLAAMKELRKKTQGLADQQSRQEMDRAIKELEDQIKAYDARGKTPSLASAPIASASSPAQAAVEDPRLFYGSELTGALMNAVLDHGAATGIGPDEWLTVAARESLDLRFMPDDPATTLVMRVKGGDLAAFRDKRLTREDARKRIEVKQY